MPYDNRFIKATGKRISFENLVAVAIVASVADTYTYERIERRTRTISDSILLEIHSFLSTEDDRREEYSVRQFTDFTYNTKQIIRAFYISLSRMHRKAGNTIDSKGDK